MTLSTADKPLTARFDHLRPRIDAALDHYSQYDDNCPAHLAEAIRYALLGPGDVVILRSISRMIYLFVLIALGLIWVPTIVHVSRFPFAMCFTVLLVATLASFTIMVARLPREARPVVRRTLRTGRVLTALGLAIGGVAAAFAAITLTPEKDLPQMLPVAVLITFGARLASTARLRAPLSPRHQKNAKALANGKSVRRP